MNFSNWINRSFLLPAVIVGFATALALGLYYQKWEPLQQAEFYTMDWRARLGKKTPIDSDLVFLGFSPQHSDRFMDDTQHSRALRLMDSEWPWNREVWARAVERLVNAGADVVLLDLLLESPRAGDEKLKQALREHRQHVSMGSRMEYQEFAGTRMVSYVPPTEQLIGTDEQLSATSENGVVGHVNLWPDEDGVVRTLDYLLHHQESTIYSLAARGLQKSGHAENIPDRAGPRLFRFGPVGDRGYRMIPFYQIFVPSIWDEYYRGGDFFKNKIVIIGPYGNWQHDVHRTSMSEIPIAGPKVHLHAISAALHDEFLSYSSSRTDFLLILAAGLIALGTCYAFKHILLRTTALLLLNIGLLALSQIAYNEIGMYILTVAPLIPPNLGISGVFIYDFIREQRERARVRSTLDRYISEDVASQILDDRDHYYDSVGGTRREVTVLFSDIRSFTTISEQLDPVELVPQLNQYLTEMVEPIQTNKGRLDKFIGDAIMAVWGDLFQLENRKDEARLAVDSAVEMLERLQDLNSEWKQQDRPEFEVGIGLSSGTAVFGNMGSNQRMELTVIGDTVNLAARMEGLTKKYKLDLVMTETVAQQVTEHYLLRTVDRVRVKGKKKPTTVYTVVARLEELENGRPPWLKTYEQGFELYQNRDFELARERFQSCQQNVGNDSLSNIYIDRCEHLIDNDPGEDWDGVTKLETK